MIIVKKISDSRKNTIDTRSTLTDMMGDTTQCISETIYYQLFTDKDEGVTITSNGWIADEVYNGQKWSDASSEDFSYVWCYVVDLDGSMTIELTIWFHHSENTTGVASSENEIGTHEKPNNTDNSNAGNSGNIHSPTTWSFITEVSSITQTPVANTDPTEKVCPIHNFVYTEIYAKGYYEYIETKAARD